MLVTRKKQPMAPPTPLAVNNLPTENVDSFKYLGVWLSHNLTWNKHIEEICKSATKQLDLIYCNCKFYQYSSQKTFTTVTHQTTSWVCSSCMGPQSPQSDSCCEKSAEICHKMYLKSWSSAYVQLLTCSELPTLQTRRYIASQFELLKRNGSFVFPNAPLAQPSEKLRLLLAWQTSHPTNALHVSFFFHK